MKFREYQLKNIEIGLKQCLTKRWCYLSMQVRTGKSLTALGIAARLGGNPKRVVFVTKKKAIPSIESDVKMLNDPTIKVETINYESLHKLDLTTHIDVWILDESHKLGAFPKPSEKTKWLKDNIHEYSSVIFLSGTPTPESGSQIFHQMYVLGEKSPFLGLTFYKWAAINCNVKKKHVGHGFPVNDYSDCHFDIKELDFISYSQKQAGFKNEVREYFLTVKMSPLIKNIIKTLKKDKIFKGNNDVILADSGAKEMQKIHQLSSGTCILDESEKAVILDESKAICIKENFEDEKIAIFYKFKAELELLKKHFDITQDIEEFNTTDKTIALQFVSGREGIKLDKADCIVAFNIDFSATTYFQFRDRMTTIDRELSDVYFIISDCGIEMDIYKAVSKKKNYTLRFYERTNLPSQNTEEPRSGGVLRTETNKDEQERNTRHTSDETQRDLFS
tara:strand:+ start:5221 stop:6564 length:1344 start_codon:yes stop_codon:yes gene_type:complete